MFFDDCNVQKVCCWPLPHADVRSGSLSRILVAQSHGNLYACSDSSFVNFARAQKLLTRHRNSTLERTRQILSFPFHLIIGQTRIICQYKYEDCAGIGQPRPSSLSQLLLRRQSQERSNKRMWRFRVWTWILLSPSRAIGL